MEGGGSQLPLKKRKDTQVRYCDHCGEKVKDGSVLSTNPDAVRQRAYRARKKRRMLAAQEELRFRLEDFIQDVAPLCCLEDMPTEEGLLTDEYEDEMQRVEKGSETE